MKSRDKRQPLFPVGEVWRSRIHTALMVFFMTAAPLLVSREAFAGVNRWTTSWPESADASCLAVDPVNPDVVYAGGANGVFKTRSGGGSWNGALNAIGVHVLGIDPSNPSNIYAGTPGGVAKSVDGGASWSNQVLAGAIYSLAFGPAKTIYAIDFDDVSYYPGPSSVYKSADDGATWTQTAAGNQTFIPRTLSVDPKNPTILYVASAYGGGIYKSSDGGSTWKFAGLAGSYFFALAVDPQNPTTLYAASYTDILKSEDSGATWRLASRDPASAAGISSLVIDPRNPATLYIGTYANGVFRSTDGGATWSEFNSGLTLPYVLALSIDSTGTRLHAAGQGVFDYQIFSGALDLAVNADDKTHLLFTDLDANLVLRSVDSSGISSGEPFGHFNGWYPRAVADGSDGLTRVLWNNLDGSAALWLTGPKGIQASYRFGPVQGWTAVDVATGGAGTTHILWTRADNRIGLWTVDHSGQVSYGPTLGPYYGWSAVAIADGADGLTRLLWNKVDGSAGLSLVGSGGLLATYRYSGSAGWRAVDVVVGADGQARILLTNEDGRMTLWRVDDSGNVTARGPLYDAPAGFTAQRIGAGPNGLTQVLWTDLNGSALLWQMSADNVYQQSFQPRPELNFRRASDSRTAGHPRMGARPTGLGTRQPRG